MLVSLWLLKFDWLSNGFYHLFAGVFSITLSSIHYLIFAFLREASKSIFIVVVFIAISVLSLYILSFNKSKCFLFKFITWICLARRAEPGGFSRSLASREFYWARLSFSHVWGTKFAFFYLISKLWLFLMSSGKVRLVSSKSFTVLTTKYNSFCSFLVGSTNYDSKPCYKISPVHLCTCVNGIGTDTGCKLVRVALSAPGNKTVETYENLDGIQVVVIEPLDGKEFLKLSHFSSALVSTFSLKYSTSFKKKLLFSPISTQTKNARNFKK